MKKIIIYCVLLLVFNEIKAQGPGYSLTFSADNISLPASNTIVPDQSAFTLEAWIKTTTIHTPYGSEGRIVNIHYSNIAGSSGSIFVGPRYPNGGSSDEVCFIYRKAGGWGCLYYKTALSDEYYDGDWHHIAATYNGIGGVGGAVSLFYDGNLVATQATSLKIPQGNYNAEIGSHDGTSRFFNGEIDEVRIWSVARTETLIRENMHRELTGTQTGLAAYYKMSNGSGTALTDDSGNSQTGTINGATWTNSTAPVPFRTVSGATNWSTTSSWLSSTYPNKTYAHTYIPYDVYADGNYEVGDLEIASSHILNINSNAALRVNGVLNNSGTIKVLSTTTAIGSFIELGSRTSTGTMIVERNYTKAGWHYTSIPISSVMSAIFQGSAFYKYNETDTDPTKRWVAIGSYENLIPVRGYDVYYPTTSDKLVSFSGTYNTGNQSISLTYTNPGDLGWNLVGNPYPSTINWDATSGWTKTNVDNAVYVWNPNSGGGSIETYINGVSTNGGSPYIAATQGFFVKCNAASPALSMTNDVRYFNSGAIRSAASNSEFRIKVKGDNNTDESVIYFTPNASEFFDGNYDAYKFYIYNVLDPQIFTLDRSNTEYSINGMPFNGQKIAVPLSLYVGTDDNYSLHFDISKLQEKLNIYLEDLKVGNVVDIIAEPVYKFSALMSDNRNRFLLHFIPIQSVSTETKITTTIEEKKADDPLVFTYGKNLTIKFADQNLNNSEIILFDLLGQKVFTDRATGELYHRNLNLNSGAYILKINSQEALYTEKIVLK